jgi:hypothetical protein
MQLLRDDCDGIFVVGPVQPSGDRVLSINTAALCNKGTRVMCDLARHVWPPDTNKDDWACSGTTCSCCLLLMHYTYMYIGGCIYG